MSSDNNHLKHPLQARKAGVVGCVEVFPALSEHPSTMSGFGHPIFGGGLQGLDPAGTREVEFEHFEE